MTVRFDEMRWPEIAEALTQPHVVILPVGSTEQHGKHLPVNLDIRTATHYAEKVAERVTREHHVRVLVAPPIPYGEAYGTPPFKKPFPGTISISLGTLVKLIEEIARSLVVQGFKNILVLNGHRENAEAIAVGLRNVNIEFPQAGLFATNSFVLEDEKWPEIMKGGAADQGHSGERETAIAMVIEPENVKCEEVYHGSRVAPLPPKYLRPFGRGIVFYSSRLGGVRDSGVHLENPCIATKEAGEKIIEAAAGELTEIVLAIVKSEGLKHEEKLAT